MVGEPNFFSITTLRPLGPRVTFTASARIFTPRRIACRDSSPCTICLAIVFLLLKIFKIFCCHPEQRVFLRCEGSRISASRANRPRSLQTNKSRVWRASLLARACHFLLSRARDHAQNFFLAHDDEILTIQFDLRAGILPKQNVIPIFHRQRKHLAFIIALAPSNRDHFALRRLILSTIRDNDAASGGAYFFYAADQDAVV